MTLIDFKCSCAEFHQSPSQEIERGEGNQRADPGAVRHPAGHGPGELGGGPVLERLSRREELVHQEDGYVLGGLLVGVVHPCEYLPSFLLLHPWAVYTKPIFEELEEQESRDKVKVDSSGDCCMFR